MAEANYAEAVAQQDVISELLGKCFAARTVCEQKDIFKIPFLRSFIPEGRTSFLILASPLEENMPFPSRDSLTRNSNSE